MTKIENWIRIWMVVDRNNQRRLWVLFSQPKKNKSFTPMYTRFERWEPIKSQTLPHLHITLILCKNLICSLLEKVGWDLRVKKVFKEPSPKNRDGSFGKATLGPPWMTLHHVHLLESPLLPESLVENPKPGRLASACSRSHRVFLPHCFPSGLNLSYNPVFQAPEMSWHGFRSQLRVHHGGSCPRHGFEGWDHRLHLITVVLVSPLHLKNHIWS